MGRTLDSDKEPSDRLQQRRSRSAIYSSFSRYFPAYKSPCTSSASNSIPKEPSFPPTGAHRNTSRLQLPTRRNRRCLEIRDVDSLMKIIQPIATIIRRNSKIFLINERIIVQTNQDDRAVWGIINSSIKNISVY